MYRSVLALLFAAVLLLSGCAAGQQTVPKEKSEQEANTDGAAFDRSDEESTYMDNLIYFNIENSFYCAKAGEDFAQKSGKVALALELERIHLFDPETQLTITNKKGV